MSQKDTEVTEGDCRVIINDYESDDEARTQSLMSLPGFSLYLSSTFCEIFNWRHDQVTLSKRSMHWFVWTKN